MAEQQLSPLRRFIALTFIAVGALWLLLTGVCFGWVLVLDFKHDRFYELGYQILGSLLSTWIAGVVLTIGLVLRRFWSRSASISGNRL